MSQLELLRQQEIAFVELVENAGAKIMSIYHEDDFEVQMKGANDPLTKADLAANQIIVEGLKILCPTIAVLSEESINTFADGEKPALYWAVDPLDGTKEFIKRNGEFTVNLALIENGIPIFGIVIAPALEVIYRGWVGYGAWKKSSKSPNWEEIFASKLSSISENNPVRVVGSRSHADPKMALWLERYQPHHLIGVGSSLKFCMVAEGVADIYPRHGTTCIWDTAAGHAVLAAAGGDVFQLDGELLTYTEPAQTKNASFVALANKMMFFEYQPFE